MPSSYTSSLRLVLPVTGELTGTWGDTVNNGLTELVEDAIAGTAAITMTDANLTLSTANEAADQARCMFIALSGGGLSATRDVICPSVSKLYVVLNDTTGGQAIRFKTAAGTGVTVPNGSRALLYCDGTNVSAAVGLPPLSGTGANGTALSSLGALAASTQAKTTNYTVVEADRGSVFFCTNTITLWLNVAAILGDGFSFGVVNTGTGDITIYPYTGDTIDGQITKTIAPNQSAFVVTNGTAWRTLGLSPTSVSDGDKGDITVSGAGATWTVGADTISRTKATADLRSGLAAAWVNFNGTGTVAIRAAFNVSSITDNSTGDYTVNFTTAMPDANYAWTLGGSLTGGYVITGRADAAVPTASTLRIGSFNASNASVDAVYINVAIFR